VSVLGPLAGSTVFTAASITEWLSSGPILVGALVVLVYGIAASSDVQSDSPWRTTPWIIPTLSTVLGVWGAFLFTHWASGIAFRPGPPPRVINVVFLFFLLMAMLSVYMAGLQLLGRFRPVASQLRSARAWTVLALSMTLFGDGNVREAYVDLISSRATTYDRELVDRYSTLRAASLRGENATVAALTRLPNSIFFRDITADSRDWRNVCYATFWKVPEVRVVRQP